MKPVAVKKVHQYFNSRKKSPVDFAHELTKAYAGSGNPDPNEISKLFIHLVELFVDLENLKSME